MRADAVAIVPAGGAARRLGAHAAAGKPAVVAGDRTLLDRVCAVLAAEVPRVIVVAAPKAAVPAVSVPVEVIRDSRPGAGPLAAIRDGLARAAATAPAPRLAVVCSCDVPLVARGVVRLLLDRAGAPGVRWALPVVAGHPQPLVSALAVDLLPEIEARLAAGRPSLREFAADLDRTTPGAVQHLGDDDFRAVDPALESFLDIDTPADLARALERLAVTPRGA